MKSSNVVIIIIIGLSICICCIMATCGFGTLVYFMSDEPAETRASSTSGTVEIGQPAPNFELGTIDGKTVSLEDFRGKPVMINFWAVWCHPCIEEMPLIQERYQQHHPDLVVLAIEEVGKISELQDFIAETGLSFTVLAGNESVARQYNIHAYPTSFFVDEYGVLQSMVVGSLSGSQLDTELAKIGVGE